MTGPKGSEFLALFGRRPMNFFEVLLHPDQEELEFKERTQVCSAANVLQVGEFQLLQLAYQEWFGKELPEALVARLFTDYMIHSAVPHWARHYARLVLMREERGLLDTNNPAYHRYDHDYHTTVPRGMLRFCAAVGILTLCLASGILVASMTVKEPASLLPPYFNKHELQPASQDLNWGRADSARASGHP
jgi:hypothetical protein